MRTHVWCQRPASQTAITQLQSCSLVWSGSTTRMDATFHSISSGQLVVFFLRVSDLVLTHIGSHYLEAFSLLGTCTGGLTGEMGSVGSGLRQGEELVCGSCVNSVSSTPGPILWVFPCPGPPYFGILLLGM